MVKDLRRLWALWERFLFARTDATPLAVLRIAFGLYLLVYYVDLFPFLKLNFFPPALVPPASLNDAPAWMLLKYIRYGTWERTAIYGLTLISALALSLGLQTRVAAFLCWALNHSWLYVPAGSNSGDNVVTVTCFLFMVAGVLGYASRVYALDAVFAKGPSDPSIPSFPLRIFQVQLTLIYFFSGFHKLASQDWYLGEALFYVAQQGVWSRGDLSHFTHPLLVGGLTYGTLAFELVLFPVFVWMRATRPYILLAGLLFHVGISGTMRVFVFGEIMPLLYLCFWDTRPWLLRIGQTKVFARLRELRTATVARASAAVRGSNQS